MKVILAETQLQAHQHGYRTGKDQLVVTPHNLVKVLRDVCITSFEQVGEPSFTTEQLMVLRNSVDMWEILKDVKIWP